MEAEKLIINDLSAEKLKVLEKYLGQDVEILIIPLDSNKGEEKGRVKSQFGVLKHKANSDLQVKEKSAWAEAVKEKYDSH